MTPMFKMFELLIACAVFAIYCVILMAVYNVLKFAFDHAKESITHWAQKRREIAEYRLQEERRRDRMERRRKGRREFGRNADRFLDGTAKKVASLYTSVRGGMSLPSVSEIEISTSTQIEKEQILFAYDPIHMLIKIEKNRLEICEILQMYKTTGTSKRARIIKQLKSFTHSQIKKLEYPLSTIAGWITIVTMASIITTTRPSTQEYVNQPYSEVPRIERNVNLNLEITQEIEQVEELFELQNESQKSKTTQRTNQKRKKARKFNRKFNRKINCLNDLPSLQYDDQGNIDEYILQKNQEHSIKIRQS